MGSAAYAVYLSCVAALRSRRQCEGGPQDPDDLTRRRHGKKRQSRRQTADSRRQGDARATDWPGAWPARHQHHADFARSITSAPPAWRAASSLPRSPSIEDRSFTFITKTPPAADLMKKAAGVERARALPTRRRSAQITQDAAPRDRRAEDEGPQRDQHRRRREDRRGHGTLDGHHRRIATTHGASPMRGLDFHRWRSR